MKTVSFTALDAPVMGYLWDGCDTLAAHKTRPALVICPGGGCRWCSPREKDALALCYPVVRRLFFLHGSSHPEQQQ